jgi:cbb3-type cytochrome oxidase maturation protein
LQHIFTPAINSISNKSFDLLDCHFVKHYFELEVFYMMWYLASCLVLGLMGFAIYLYYLKQGQFDDVEDIKYQMFRDEEP